MSQEFADWVKPLLPALSLALVVLFQGLIWLTDGNNKRKGIGLLVVFTGISCTIAYSLIFNDLGIRQPIIAVMGFGGLLGIQSVRLITLKGSKLRCVGCIGICISLMILLFGAVANVITNVVSLVLTITIIGLVLIIVAGLAYLDIRDQK